MRSEIFCDDREWSDAQHGGDRPVRESGLCEAGETSTLDPKSPIMSVRYWRSRCRTPDCFQMRTRQYLKARAIRLYRRTWPIVLTSSVVAIWARQGALLSGLVQKTNRPRHANTVGIPVAVLEVARRATSCARE